MNIKTLLHISAKGLAICLALLCFHTSTGMAFASFTIEDEKKLGKEFYDQLKEKGALIQDPKVTGYVEQIGHLLLSRIEQSYFDFTFSVIDSSGINAFATPGGYVYLYRGLIERAEDESQIAGVLAHEIAHIKARHIAQMIESSRKIGIATLAAVIAGAFLGGDATAAVLGFSTATATTLNLKYSREHEEEADRLGMQYLTAPGYDGEGMLSFLKIMRQHEFYSNAVPSYFLTHPGTTDRIRYLDGLLQTKYTKRGTKSIVGRLERIKTILFIDRRNPDSSIRYFQDVLNKDPDNPDALYGLAVSQGRLGMTSESFANFQKALEFSPDDADILRDLGISYFNLGRMDDAVQILQRAYRANREDPDTTSYLGRAYGNTGKSSDALELYKKLLLKNPDGGQVHYNLAMLYGKINRKGESHYHFGIYFKKEGKTKSALFHFKAAQSLFPADTEMAGKIRKEMDSIEGKDPPDPENKRSKKTFF